MNPKVRTPVAAYEVLSSLEEKNVDKMQAHEMVVSMMDMLNTSQKKDFHYGWKYISVLYKM